MTAGVIEKEVLNCTWNDLRVNVVSTTDGLSEGIDKYGGNIAVSPMYVSNRYSR